MSSDLIGTSLAHFRITGKLGEGGMGEVHLTTYPRPGARWQVPIGGGHHPRWNPERSELVYPTGDDTLWAVPMDGADPEIGIPQLLFTADVPFYDGWDVRGERVLEAGEAGDSGGGDGLSLILGWPRLAAGP
jgi:hypothetical protein